MAKLRHRNEALPSIIETLDPATAYLFRRLRAERGGFFCQASTFAHLYPEIRACDRIGLIGALSYGCGSAIGFIADMMPILPAWSDLGYDDWREIVRRAHWFGLDWAIVPFMYQQLEVDAVRMVIELRPGDPEVAADLRWPALHREIRVSHHVDMSFYGLTNEMLYQARERLRAQGAPRARVTPIRTEWITLDESDRKPLRMIHTLPPEGEEETIAAYRRSAGIEP
jgi:hypothetical protein